MTAALRRDPEIEVVGSAADPLEARALINELNPDVITLDVEMPNMNGLEFLEKIMRLRPMPVVMVSTLTQAGAEITIAKRWKWAPSMRSETHATASPPPTAFAELTTKVKTAARSRVRARGDGPRRAPPSPPTIVRFPTSGAGDRRLHRRGRGPADHHLRASPPTARRRSSPSICRRPSPPASPPA
jgi:two-component system chemotaxis response regulator CheB